ncbi:chymotrypsin-1-like [Choristoneura fumiferana]|uniref:chymotrypsin-1-like n=1 Tax=Choristoneura fumiferana TaxID=7141 RepID=UPI003D15B059
MLHGCAFTSFTDPQSFYSSHRIVGGIEAPDGSAPYMVALLVGDIVPSLLCGGSLIAPQRMLTAAHCIEPMKSWTGGLLQILRSARAVLGTNKWSDERRTAQFSGYRIHPEYDRWNIKNDIGLIFTTNEVVLDKRVNIIALNYERMRGGENIIVTGWGTTTLWGEIPDQLQLLYVKVMSPSLCEHAVKEAQGELRYPPVNHEVEICTKHEKGAGHGMCHGDSGSALVDELGKQVGIVSWGWPCARNHPDIHARISAFLDFLSE